MSGKGVTWSTKKAGLFGFWVIKQVSQELTLETNSQRTSATQSIHMSSHMLGTLSIPDVVNKHVSWIIEYEWDQNHRLMGYVLQHHDGCFTLFIVSKE